MTKTGHLKAMAAAADGTVYVAFKHGKIERYLPHGKLLFSKVGTLRFQPVSQNCVGRNMGKTFSCTCSNSHFMPPQSAVQLQPLMTAHVPCRTLALAWEPCARWAPMPGLA